MSKPPKRILIDGNIALATRISIQRLLADEDLVYNLHPTDIENLRNFVDEMNCKIENYVNRVCYQPPKKGATKNANA